MILTGTPLSRRLLPLPRDPRPLPPADNSLVPSEAGPKVRMEVRSEPTLSCSFAMKSPSGASTSSSSESFGSKLLRLLCRLEAGGPRVVGVEGRIMGSLKSLDGRRSGKVTLLRKGNLFLLSNILSTQLPHLLLYLNWQMWLVTWLLVINTKNWYVAKCQHIQIQSSIFQCTVQSICN